MMNVQYIHQEGDLAKIEDDFLNGNLKALLQRRCPTCGGKLDFSVYKGHRVTSEPWKGRFRGSITIGCKGECNRMLSHLDGLCPEWAEGITDWDKFSNELYD